MWCKIKMFYFHVFVFLTDFLQMVLSVLQMLSHFNQLIGVSIFIFCLTGIDLGLRLLPCGHWSMLWSIFNIASIWCQTSLIAKVLICLTIELGESPFLRNENLHEAKTIQKREERN